MSPGSVSTAIVSLFGLTKSAVSVTGCAVAVVTVAGTGGIVVDVSGGTTIGATFLWQAGATMSARRAMVTAKALNALFIVRYLFADSSRDRGDVKRALSLTLLRPIR